MSEDRLEKALEGLRQETADEGAIGAARDRVWDQIASVAGSTCAEFRPDFAMYLSGGLSEGRRALVDDHLSRCSTCRAALADLKGERKVIPMPQRSSSRWLRVGTYAAAAALVLGVLYAGRGTLDALMAPSGPRATITAVEGSVYRLSGEALAANATIAEGEVVRTGPGAHAVLQLADGSIVEVNERTELSATAVWSGMAVHLQRGDVIVQAAKQRRGHLRVLTRDSIASVKGTVFAVSAGLGGSVVSVVEGSVAVRQPGTDVLLSPGDQVASSAGLTMSIAQAVSWSPGAQQYLELLASLGVIDRQLAERLPIEQRTSSTLLPYLPGAAFAYGAIPNMGGRLGLALTLADQQAAENPAFGAWWNSEGGRGLRQMLDRLQSVSWLLGDEIAFTASAAGPGSEGVPMVLSRVQPGRRAALTQALNDLFEGTGEAALPFSVSEDLLVVSVTPEYLTLALGLLRQGAGSPFAAAIADRYRRGASSLIGFDAPVVVAMSADDDAPPVELAAMMGVKYVFFEQRAPAGAEENEVTLLFDGQRTGMASWLADAGSAGVADYLPSDAMLAGYVSMRQPSQLFQEFKGLMNRVDGGFANDMAKLDELLGLGFTTNLVSALGSEAAFAVNGMSVSGPRWMLTAMAYNPAVIDSSVQTVVERFNTELGSEEQAQRIVFTQESAGGRTWNSVGAAGLPIGLTWTYDGGYMVAASDRATAERAIATRNGGSPLVWAHEFRSQLPASSGVHPSAFVWLNTQGALGALVELIPNPAAAGLLGDRESVLVVFDVKPNQIHAASRARLSRVVLDLMAVGALSGDDEAQAGIGVQ